MNPAESRRKERCHETVYLLGLLRARLILVLGGLFSLLAAEPAESKAKVATGVKSFEGVEDPSVRYIVATGKFEKDDFVNIKDVGDNTVRMTLRFRKGEWWDGDQGTDRTDRQRAEVKGLGPHQKDGETFEYGTTFRTNASFQATKRFCHIFQLKATDGDKAAPLVTLTLRENGAGSVGYSSGKTGGFGIARKFTWKPSEWQTVKIRIKVSTEKEGELSASIDGDEFQGVKGITMFRPQATDYRPKWGLYRGVDKDMNLGDDFIEHKNASARKE